MKLDHEPTVEEVMHALASYTLADYDETVFCGYGEPLIRLAELKEISAELKHRHATVRVNTNGHGNLIHHRNIVPELEGLADIISVSLNASNPDEYVALHKPAFGISTFDGILDFIRESLLVIPRVIVTCIQFPDNWVQGAPAIDVNRCRALVEKLGAEFRVRPYLFDYEES